jgi:hypothetical protein
MSAPNFQQDIARSAEAYFEPQLRVLGLAVDQIEQQTVPELEASLERVNEAIAHPDSFGMFTARITTDLKILVTTSSESTFTVGVLPTLLQRKSLILRRLADLRGTQGIRSLRELVASSVSDAAVRGNLEEELTRLEESRTIDQEAARVAVQSDIEGLRQATLLKVEAFERRSHVWRSFLERESIAGIVGAILLLILAVALMGAMYFGVATSEVVSNSFLLILGYFFGQSVAKTQSGT